MMHEFLRGTAWETASITPIAGDASVRQYARLSLPPAILMMDPSGDTDRFARIAALLKKANLCPPQIHMHDPEQGLMVISDLGPVDVASHLKARPEDEHALYTAATSVLCKLHDNTVAAALPQMDHQTAAEMISLAAEFYAVAPTTVPDLCHAVLNAFDAHVDPALHLAMRDYHAENLIWRPTLEGTDRIGLLDFQDACMAPLGYDLMSLIRDARRDVSQDVADAVTTQFCTHAGQKLADLSAHLACVGAQRNLRILGIFARLATQGGKPHYLKLIPRVWRYLMLDLSHPALGPLRQTVTAILPAPDLHELSLT